MTERKSKLVERISSSLLGLAVCGVGLYMVATGGDPGAVELGLVIGGAWLVDSSAVRELARTALETKEAVEKGGSGE